MDNPKILVNCHVFDGRRGDVQRDQYILVRDGKIAEVGGWGRPRHAPA